MADEFSAEFLESEEKFRGKTVDNVNKILAAVCPDKYASSKSIKKVKQLKKEKKFWEAVDAAEPKDPEPGEQYVLSYNSAMESLEPIYFWILDFMQQGDPSKVKKIADNFISSPGSGHFSELMGKATKMQEEAMKLMQTIGILIKSIIQIVYDLRQFEMRLRDYKAAKSKNSAERDAGIIALKQIWMDNVDIKRGNTSLKSLAFSQASFTTLIDAFMIARSLEEAKKMDLNERVKRILEQRILEFTNWKDLSEKEIRKRYNIQRAWLKGQVDTLKLYSKWAYPYLKAAEELRMSTSLSNNAALVKAFNTIVLQLTLFKKDAVKVAQASLDKDLPNEFKKLEEGKDFRKTFRCILVDFMFRGIPQRVEQHYGFGGRADVTFRSYALNDDEFKQFEAAIDESEMREAMRLIEGTTQSSLKEIQDDLDYFLKEEGEREDEEKEEKSEGDINPFSALLGLGGKKEKSKQKKKDSVSEKFKPIKSDNYYEEVIRAYAAYKAKGDAFTVYDIYKKSHGMASVPFDKSIQQGNVEVPFSDLFRA